MNTSVYEKYKRRKQVTFFFILILLGITGCLLFLSAEDNKFVKDYPAMIDNHGQVYDGDTIQDVAILLKHFKDYEPVLSKEPEFLFPGLILKDKNLYTIIDIRIKGIDTPEKRPFTKGRKPASIALEKSAAVRAQRELNSMLKKHDYEFIIRSPKYGKYAGRIVADVLIGKDRINVAEKMIELGHAYYYNGEQKREFDDWYGKKDK